MSTSGDVYKRQEYDWGKENGGKVTYGQDLHEFLFDYSEVPTDNRVFDEMSTEEVRATINQAANELPDDKKNALKQVLKNSKNGKE